MEGDTGAPENFEKNHQGFLRVGGHWDPRRQMYVRRDGSYLPDPDSFRHG
jgi:hypothetical protein